MNLTRKFRVSGRVQGVFFRVSAKQEADRLGLGGWVRNCADGDVEAVASGSKDKLDAFAVWLNEGPAMARVDKLHTEDCEALCFDSFSVR